MCGIIGITGDSNAPSLLVDGLKRLEYRGYDSAGIATVEAKKVHRLRAQGKIKNLEAQLTATPIYGSTGIGHTRWATHGAPSEINAHPHATDKVAVVHNGIIENFRELRAELQKLGYAFTSETDTEVIPILLTHYLKEGVKPEEAVSMALPRLKGAFALGMIFANHAEIIIGARRGSPLAVGYGEGAMYLGSDAMALAHLTQKISYLEEGDWCVLTPTSVQIFDEKNHAVKRDITTSTLNTNAIGKGSYRHFMLKEIEEQPGVVGDALKVYISPLTGALHMPPLPCPAKDIDRVQIVACGTSYYAAMVAQYWLEEIARLSVRVDIASEYRYRNAPADARELLVVISQSGETADTLACLRHRKNAQPTIAIVNVPESSLAREAGSVLYTHAGPEIGVASTKAFTTQLATLACLTAQLAQTRGCIKQKEAEAMLSDLLNIPSLLVEALHTHERCAALAHQLQHARDMLYIGRGTSYALAHEAALKMKEISYIHAEAYAAGELKHGPIALIDEHVPVIVLAPSDPRFEKTASNVQEAAARGGKIILITDEAGENALGDIAIATITLPKTSALTAPLVYALPIQLLAYHTAVLKGTDVDQPRNLAKSVTVE